nr:MAG TPA: hypothetical protein [Caudoviricetes sp.]
MKGENREQTQFIQYFKRDSDGCHQTQSRNPYRYWNHRNDHNYHNGG